MYCTYCGQPTNFLWDFYPGIMIHSNYPVTVTDIQGTLGSLDWVEGKIRNNKLTAACEKCIREIPGPGDDEWKATPEQWLKRIEKDRQTLKKRLMKIMSGGKKGGRQELSELLKSALAKKERGEGKP